jgi:hypothetical protein
VLGFTPDGIRASTGHFKTLSFGNRHYDTNLLKNPGFPIAYHWTARSFVPVDELV